MSGDGTELLSLAHQLVDAELPMSRDDGREAKRLARLVLEHLDVAPLAMPSIPRYLVRVSPRSETVETLKLYVEEGVHPGGFLTAVLANDLFDAFRRGDEDSLAEFGAIVTWVYLFAPGACLGTREKVAKWRGTRRTKGFARLEERATENVSEPEETRTKTGKAKASP